MLQHQQSSLAETCKPAQSIYRPTSTTCTWEFVHNILVGKGGFGSVTPVCCLAAHDKTNKTSTKKTTTNGSSEGKTNTKNCNFVAKYVSFTNPELPVRPEDFVREVKAQVQCAEATANQSCPQVLDAWMCEHGGVMIMPAVRISLRNLLLNTVGDQFLWDLPVATREVIIYIIADALLAARRFHLQVGLQHNDLHAENVLADFSDLPSQSRQTNSPVQDYLARHFQYKIIDLAKAQPLAQPQQNNQMTTIRQQQMAYDYQFLCNSIQLDVLASYAETSVPDESTGIDTAVNVLHAPCIVLLQVLQVAPQTNSSALVEAVRQETTFLEPDIFASEPPDQEESEAAMMEL